MTGLDAGSHIGGGNDALDVVGGISQGSAGNQVSAGSIGLFAHKQFQFGNGLASHEFFNGSPADDQFLGSAATGSHVAAVISVVHALGAQHLAIFVANDVGAEGFAAVGNAHNAFAAHDLEFIDPGSHNGVTLHSSGDHGKSLRAMGSILHLAQLHVGGFRKSRNSAENHQDTEEKSNRLFHRDFLLFYLDSFYPCENYTLNGCFLQQMSFKK